MESRRIVVVMRSPDRSARVRTRWIGAVVGLGLVIASVTIWFSQLVSTAGVKSECTTPSKSMTQAIDAQMHDARARVGHVQVVEADDTRFESLFFASAKVRVAGVLVGVGTWASNVRDFGPGDFRGWAHTPSYVNLSPVNELAGTISSGRGVSSMQPGMTRPARFSQSCVVGGEARK